MHRPHIALWLITFASTLGFAMTAVAQQPQKILSDPARGPLIVCYDQGLQTAVDEVKKASETTAQYFVRMALAGGPLSLSHRVRDVCDDWYRGNKSIPEAAKEDNIAAWGLLFSTYAFAVHKEFLDTCLSFQREDGDPDVASLCRIVSQ